MFSLQREWDSLLQSIRAESLICILWAVIANCCSVVQSAENSLLVTFCCVHVLSPVTKHGETMSGGKGVNLGTGDQRMDVLGLSFNRLGVGDEQARDRQRSGRVVF